MSMNLENETVLLFPKLGEDVPVTKLPDYLTEIEEKKFFYALEPNFRESFEDAQEVFGSNFEAYSLATSAMIFKPDAIVDRKVEIALNHVMKKGFTPIAFSLFQYNKYIIREDWKYQYNIATRNRMRAVDYLLETAPSLFVVFKKNTEQFSNACVEMTSLKGHSDPAYRTPEDLRYHLNGINSLLNYIHTCDEPADFYRGMGLYFKEYERKKILQDISQRNDRTQQLIDYLQKLYQQWPSVDLNFDRVINALKNSVQKLEAADAEKVLAICHNPLKISEEDWLFLYELLIRKNNGILNRWDTNIILTGTVSISMDNATALIK